MSFQQAVCSVAIVPAICMAACGNGSSQLAEPSRSPSRSLAGPVRRTPVPRNAVFTDLGEIVLESDLDRQFPAELRYGQGGGLDLEMMFTKLYLPQLRRCAKAVRVVADQWAQQHGLTLANSEESPTRVLLHYRCGDPDGFFEVTYRIHKEYAATHTFFGFYDANLHRVAPEQIPEMIEKYGLSEFVGDLRKAAECADGQKL